MGFIIQLWFIYLLESMCESWVTKYSRLIVSNEREKKLAIELIESLEKYKYKKEVENIDNEVKAKFSIFMDSLDV